MALSLIHIFACGNQRQIPVGIPVGIRIFLHVFPIKTPRAQINVIVEFVIAVFIVAADTDHIIVVQKMCIRDRYHAACRFAIDFCKDKRKEYVKSRLKT